MEISDLLGKLKGTDKDKPKPFLALEITDEVVVSAVWQVEDGKTSIVSVGTPVEWDGDKEDADELVRAADATVSNSIEGLTPEPDQVIFGVSPSWANDKGILPSKITLIKNICKELAIKPLGFVVITDSLLRYLKMQEGTPTNSIFVHVARDTITVTLAHMGKIDATETIGRGDDLAADVVEGLSRFPAKEELPSRILVYDGMHNIDEEIQNLLSYDWQNTFNFLHIPKIENLPKDVVIRSIAVAGGAEVAKAIGFEITEPVIEENSDLPKADDVVSSDQDQASNDQNSPLLSAADFGFGSPASKSKQEVIPHKKLPPSTRVDLTLDEDEEEVVDEMESQTIPSPGPVAKIKRTPIVLPRFHFPHFKLPSFNKTMLILGGLVTLVVISIFATIWLVPKAVLTIYVEPKNLEENTTITLDTTITVPVLENGKIPATPIEKIVTGEATVPTTGKKTIGDPARGEVTVYNRTSLSKTFAKGTTLTAKSLKFTLDDSVTVASKSAGADYVDVPGKSVAKITAKAIGKDSNLGEDSEFTIENFTKDSYVAKNDNALSGGTSQEIQVVDKADQTNLSHALLTKLKDQGKAELLSELGSGSSVYVMEKGSSIEKEDYSLDIGSEGTSLTGTMNVKVKGVSFATQDVESLMSSALSSAIPAGYTRTSVLPTVTLGDLKEETEDAIEIGAKISVSLLPEIDSHMVQSALRGLASNQIEQALTSVVGLKGAEVSITPKWLSSRFKWMPRNPGNIVVNIVPAL